MTSVTLGEWLAKRRKWLVTVANFCAIVTDLTLVHGTARTATLLVLAALNSAGVHQVSNES